MSEPPNSKRTLLPRFSLLTAILLMTIAGLAIVTVQLWREVGPLREENRQMRTELGLLIIEDPSLAYAVTLPTFERDTWKWRIYLPPGGQHTLYEYSGQLPPKAGRNNSVWLGDVKKSGPGSMATGGHLQGEFSMEARLIKEGDAWLLGTSFSQAGKGLIVTGTSVIKMPTDDWLSNRRARLASTDLRGEQIAFKPGEPILLLFMGRAEVSSSPTGGIIRKPPSGPADAFAVWIEPAQVPSGKK